MCSGPQFLNFLFPSPAVTNPAVRQNERPSFRRLIDHPSHQRPTPQMHAETEMAIIPRMPQEVIDEILGHLTPDSDHGSLQSCALVSRLWVPSCRRRLFHTVTFTWSGMERWYKTFPVPEEGPARLVRNLRFRIGGCDYAPEEFFEHTPWFTNVERVTLLSHQGKSQPLWISWYWRFPQSATSLSISADSITVAQMLDIMVRLPSLDNLSLSGTSILYGIVPQGTGTDPRWRFGGKLQLHGIYADPCVTSVLLKIPTGLRFTEVEICCIRNSLLSTVKLVEACRKTLTKLSYTVSRYGKPTPPALGGSSAFTDATPRCR